MRGHAFAFGLQSSIIGSALSGQLQPDLRQFLTEKPMARMATFLSNHDGFAGARVFDQMEGELTAYRLAAATYYLLPGVPFTLYGEEIGMSMASKAKYSDTKIRAPMSWSSEESILDDQGAKFYTFGGFTRLQESWKQKLFRPQADNWSQLNVASELSDPNSLLSYYTQLGQLRQQHTTLREGDFKLIPLSGTANNSVLAFSRSSKDESLLVLINYAKSKQKVELPLANYGRLQNLWPQDLKPVSSKKGKLLILELAPQQVLVLKQP